VGMVSQRKLKEVRNFAMLPFVREFCQACAKLVLHSSGLVRIGRAVFTLCGEAGVRRYE
jgi:hypothetical protein